MGMLCLPDSTKKGQTVLEGRILVTDGLRNSLGQGSCFRTIQMVQISKKISYH